MRSAAALVVAAAAAMSSEPSGPRLPPPVQNATALDRAATVYCDGSRILEAVQRANLFDDCKEFVDMPLKIDPEDALAAFDALPKPLTNATLRRFVEEHFDEAGSDVEAHRPDDWTPTPALLERVAPAWAPFVGALNDIWPDLVRRTTDAVSEHPERRSLFFRRRPFVVPGGRFRESYYWDTRPPARLVFRSRRCRGADASRRNRRRGCGHVDRRIAATPRRRRVETESTPRPRTRRYLVFRSRRRRGADASRRNRRRGCGHVDRRIAATPRLRRGYVAGATGRIGAPLG